MAPRTDPITELTQQLLHKVCTLTILLLVACTEIPSAPELDRDDLAQLAALGFSKDMVTDRGYYYLAGQDIQINKSDLRRSRATAHRGDQSPYGPQFQYTTTNLVTNPAAIQTITVDLSGVPNTSVWHDAVVEALPIWSNIQNSYVKMVLGTPGSITIQLIDADAGLAGRGTFPAGGDVGDTVYLNENFRVGGAIPSHAVYLRNIVHELGHTIGFRHTNWNQVDCVSPPFVCRPCNGHDPSTYGANYVPYTPTSGGDPASVMNGCTADQAWNGFSNYDTYATRYRYPIPSTTVSVTFPDGVTPTINWAPLVGATSYRVSLYNVSFWITPEGSMTNYGYTGVVGSTTGTSLADPSRSYTGYSTCHFYYPDIPEEETRDYYYSVDAYVPNGSSLSLGIAAVANEPNADSCY